MFRSSFSLCPSLSVVANLSDRELEITENLDGVNNSTNTLYMTKARLKETFKKLISEVELPITFLNMCLRRGMYVEKGNRYSDSYLTQQGVSFDSHHLSQRLRQFLHTYETHRELYNQLSLFDFSYFKADTYEQDCLRIPSISNNVIAGFFTRIFEKNNFQFAIDQEAFESSFEELWEFLHKETISITTFVGLHGPEGDLDSIKISENVCIQRASHEVAKLYGLYYSSPDGYYINTFEGDYLLEINYQIPKKDFLTLDKIEEKLIRKWFIITLFGDIGNIEKGKILRISSDWPLVTIKAPHMFYNYLNEYSHSRRSTYKMNTATASRLTAAAEIIIRADIEKLEAKIIYSLDRLKKSKSTTNINDRIVELALAFEYLINTSSEQVTLQLTLKAIKLFNENNVDANIADRIKKFYKLRSTIMHGNDILDNNSKNEEIVDYAESIIMQITLRMISLNQQFTYMEISDALNKSLFINKSLHDLLDKKN